MAEARRKPGHRPFGERPFQASYVVSGIRREEIFSALLDARRFPEWASGLRRVRVLDAGGAETSEVRPGTALVFYLSAAGMTHEVESAVTAVESPRLLEWSYRKGAVGSGGWLIEAEGQGAARMTLSTDYTVKPAWLDRLAHRPFFRGLVEELLRRSMRRFEEHLRQSSTSRRA